MQASQICLILIVGFIVYCLFFANIDNFKNKENYNGDIMNQDEWDQPVFSKKCCGNLYNMTPENNPDPNYNVTYFPSNINHLGDGDEQQGCRCLTLKELNYMSSRGGNS